MFWRYYMKQAADSYDSLKAYAWSDNAVLEGTSADELLTASGEGLTVKAGDGADTITAYGRNEMIDGGDGDDSIVNCGSDVTISGGAGDDTINHAAHYIYALGDGNDLITNYSSDDTIHLLSVENTNSLIAGSDAILKIGDGLITLKNAAAFALNVVDGNNTPITLSQPTVESAINFGEVSYLFDESTGALRRRK